MLGLLLLVGCGTKGDGDTGANNDDGPSNDDGSTTSDTVDPTNPMPTSGPEPTGGGSEGSGDTTEGPSSFIMNPDGSGGINECDVWTQDCPEGEKCMPWANDGGSSWNATRCSPVEPNPGEPGDECTVEGSGVSGIDSCAVSSMCWDVDGETNVGTCVPFCSGSEDAPECDDPDNACSITNEGVLILCLPTCDPLLQDCVEGQACYPEENGWICSPDASGEGGNVGDPCQYINVCNVGTGCFDESLWPGGCGGTGGCCIPFCDLSGPDCPMDTECQAVFEDPNPGDEDFGVCAVPQ
ncbi:MAG: ribulose phosphate epimerase [Myxococcales bacterium]|nr:ribulose phosphate epimerase [Myxococcales bacterium]